MTDAANSVFVNCPFDDDYKPLFEALLFTIASSGYRARCALEEIDAADIRFDKLCRLVTESQKSVHDLSRIELGRENNLPRFNMPLELGLFLGARRFGGKAHQRKSALVLTAEKHSLPVYLSDTAGSDAAQHHGKPIEIIRSVRGYLRSTPSGQPLPGASRIQAVFEHFKSVRSRYARALHIAPDEIDPFRDYRDYLVVQEEYLKAVAT